MKNKIHFICGSCKEEMILGNMPKCCPFCGSETIQKDIGAAQKAITRCAELVPLIQNAYEQYANYAAEYSKHISVLNQYKKRGVIEDSDIPKCNLTRVSDVIKQKRESARKEIRDENNVKDVIEA